MTCVTYTLCQIETCVFLKDFSILKLEGWTCSVRYSAYRDVPAGPTPGEAEPVPGDRMPAFGGASRLGGRLSTRQRTLTLSFSLHHYTQTQTRVTARYFKQHPLQDWRTMLWWEWVRTCTGRKSDISPNMICEICGHMNCRHSTGFDACILMHFLF